MQTLWTVVVLLALVGLGVLFLARLNAQNTGRMPHHRYADWKASRRLRRQQQAEAARGGPRMAGPPPPSGKAGSDL
ncbi:hypothetical protein OIU91_22755 [Streptomyces sp. NBC_01456]|uniref:hypothetical protein n=1 Tax=unclassified Streptomyces TaxID=2593676 RepID=UPI002E340B3D|nr:MULTISPECIES: hypothetical protein [unclassified Streptomyces]